MRLCNELRTLKLAGRSVPDREKGPLSREAVRFLGVSQPRPQAVGGLEPRAVA